MGALSKILPVGLLAVGFWLLAAPSVFAATLYLSPSSGNITVGDEITVGVYVTSNDQALNAYSGSLSYSADVIEVTGVSGSGLTDFWVVEPSYSNASGSASFEGVIFNPGFIGAGGQILTLTLKAKSAGAAAITFADGSVLANDGQGTEILTDVGSATFAIAAAAVPPQQPPTGTPVPGSPPTTPIPDASLPPTGEVPDDQESGDTTEPGDIDLPGDETVEEPDVSFKDSNYFYLAVLAGAVALVIASAYILLRKPRVRRSRK